MWLNIIKYIHILFTYTLYKLKYRLKPMKFHREAKQNMKDFSNIDLCTTTHFLKGLLLNQSMDSGLWVSIWSVWSVPNSAMRGFNLVMRGFNIIPPMRTSHDPWGLMRVPTWQRGCLDSWARPFKAWVLGMDQSKLGSLPLLMPLLSLS